MYFPKDSRYTRSFVILYCVRFRTWVVIVRNTVTKYRCCLAPLIHLFYIIQLRYVHSRFTLSVQHYIIFDTIIQDWLESWCSSALLQIRQIISEHSHLPSNHHRVSLLEENVLAFELEISYLIGRRWGFNYLTGKF